MAGGTNGSDRYQTRAGCFDEVFATPGEPRDHAMPLAAALDSLGPEALAAAGRSRDSILMSQGITFDAAGPDDGPVPTARSRSISCRASSPPRSGARSSAAWRSGSGR